MQLREVGFLFLKLGLVSFGGPAAHNALMEEEVVRRRGWVSREEFLDLMSATNLIPGPNSTELAIHLGLRRAGWPGFFVAGICFILPASLIVTAIAAIYCRYGAELRWTQLLRSVAPVITAVVLLALIRFLHSAVKSTFLGCVAAGSLVASLAGVHELLVLLLAGGAGLAGGAARPGAPNPPAAAGALAGALAPGLKPTMMGVLAATVPPAVGCWPLFWTFLKVGSVLFGSGYVLLAFLHADFVVRYGWLTEAELLEAIAVGQATPGPLFSTATFIGYILGGPAGALAATVGIFLPAFVFVAVSGPLIPRLRRWPATAALLDGLNAASLALMVGVSWHLGRAALVDLFSVGLFVLTLGLAWRWRVNSTWLILGGLLVGAGRALLG